MDRALALNFTEAELCCINACRLCVGVEILSDVVEPDGRSVDRLVVRGQAPLYSSPKGLVAYQDNPDRLSWRLWRRLLATFCEPSSLLLQIALGRWLDKPQNLQRQWRCFWDPISDSAFCRQLDQYQDFRCEEHGQLTLSSRVVTILPSTAVPTSFDPVTAIPVPPPASTHRIMLPHLVPDSFSDFLSKLPHWEVQLLRSTTLLVDVFTLVHRWTQDGKIVLGPDGSAPRFKGSFGWSCLLSSGLRLATGSGVAAGLRTASYRAESYGALSGLRFLHQVCNYTGLREPLQIKLHSDSESMVLQVQQMHGLPFYYYNFTLRSEWDVLQAIVNTSRLLPCTPSFPLRSRTSRSSSITFFPLSSSKAECGGGCASCQCDSSHGAVSVCGFD